MEQHLTYWQQRNKNNQKCSTPRPGLQRHILRIDCGCHHAYHVYHSANPMRSWGQTKTLLRPADLRVTLIPVTSIDMSGHCIINLKIMINSSDQRDRSDQRSQQVSQTNLSICVLHHYFSASDFPNHIHLIETTAVFHHDKNSKHQLTKIIIAIKLN